MDTSKLFFKIIDKVSYRPFNPKKALARKDVTVKQNIPFGDDDICTMDIYFPAAKRQADKTGETVKPERTDKAWTSKSKEAAPTDGKIISDKADKAVCGTVAADGTDMFGNMDKTRKDISEGADTNDGTGEKLPLLFYIHGGGFTAGDKSLRKAICLHFASLGFVTVCANYGLCPQYRFPTPINHLVTALNKVCETYKNIDTNKIAVAGDSAGAYYAAMLCAANRLNETVTPLKVKISAAVLICGVYDLAHSLSGHSFVRSVRALVRSFTGTDAKKVLTDYEYKDIISPTCFCDAIPPSCIIYAKKDFFCRGQSELLISGLEDAGIYYESYHSVSYRRNHCFSLNFKKSVSKEANGIMDNFLIKFKEGALPTRLNGVPRICEWEKKHR